MDAKRFLDKYNLMMRVEDYLKGITEDHIRKHCTWPCPLCKKEHGSKKCAIRCLKNCKADILIEMNKRDSIARCTVVKEAVIRHAVETGRLSGKMACPICNIEDALSYGYARDYNGHVGATCSNGCISLRE